jgi:hypothetical protein
VNRDTIAASFRANSVLSCIAVACAIAPSLIADYVFEPTHPLQNHLFFQSCDLLLATAIFAYVKRQARKAFNVALERGFVSAQAVDAPNPAHRRHGCNAGFKTISRNIPDTCPKAWLVQLYMESHPGIFRRDISACARAR